MMNPENMVMTSTDPALGVAPFDVGGYNTYNDGGAGFGIGVAFDTISNQGISFKDTNFGINLDLNLLTDNPQSVYMFVHSKTTLVFNQQGIQIVN